MVKQKEMKLNPKSKYSNTLNSSNTSDSLSIWNVRHKKQNYKRDSIVMDDWLDLFEQEILECSTPILDLGCGGGNNTLYLVNREKKVIACDFSPIAINLIEKNFPEIQETKCFDMQKGLPFQTDSFEIIIADLCLHYFLKIDTEKIIQEIKRVLKKDGLLIFRVNSVNDTNHGAGQGRELEENVYLISDGTMKRFFTKENIRYFFQNFEIIYIKEEIMTRYKLEKKLYRVCVRNT